jgi:proteasome alpha subunit
MLANTYAQILGTIFTTESKPYEVELTVAEVGLTQDTDQLYRLTYDGSVNDENGVVVMGAAADAIGQQVREGHREGVALDESLRLAVTAMSTSEEERRDIPAGQLEVAILDRRRPRRTFRRLSRAQLEPLLSA